MKCQLFGMVRRRDAVDHNLALNFLNEEISNPAVGGLCTRVATRSANVRPSLKASRTIAIPFPKSSQPSSLSTDNREANNLG